MRVALVIGTRPQIIKSAPIIKEACRRGLELDVVHTGQYYDYELFRVFFNELGLPDPVVNLGVYLEELPLRGWFLFQFLQLVHQLVRFFFAGAG